MSSEVNKQDTDRALASQRVRTFVCDVLVSEVHMLFVLHSNRFIRYVTSPIYGAFAGSTFNNNSQSGRERLNHN